MPAKPLHDILCFMHGTLVENEIELLVFSAFSVHPIRALSSQYSKRSIKDSDSITYGIYFMLRSMLRAETTEKQPAAD